mmetsp:Transcript_1145/g.3451  ORF Transcript_1145/g.3451 Transcript_1145/m.3451 type:complete len:677 (-) Transcript_1145:1016-3046(-)|eukprot:CAMPEP_0206140030 /NCGR_PEP_ID=MMETSP1473-20131121/8083_1 /ASSEMBLY_ACC=CAM_ASM_001109 /TAXON_ID=1461547 /ORGANISM="Stichococcus sp, Strain RCC1054" /LENGTH=676 /DNA_ID=CAMNT_0053534017 /DNA_START=164 /DNA_END=2194 /DNA_ORIENTATION=-
MALQKCLMQHQLLSPRCGAHSSFAQSASPRPVLRPRCATGYRVYQNPSNSCSSPAALPPPLLRRHLQHQRWCGHTIAASAQGSGGSGSRGTPPAPDIAQGIDAAGAPTLALVSTGGNGSSSSSGDDGGSSSSSGPTSRGSGGRGRGGKNNRRPNPLARFCWATVEFFAKLTAGFVGLLWDCWSRRNWHIVRKGLELGVSLAVFSYVPWWFYHGATGANGMNAVNAVKMVRPPQEVVYSQFLTAVNGGVVRSVRFDNSADRVYFDLKSDTAPAPPADTRKRSQTASNTASNTGSAAAELEALTAAVPSTATAQFYAKQIHDPNLVDKLSAAGVEFGAAKASMKGTLMRFFGGMAFLWVPFMPLLFYMRSVINGKTKSREKKPGSPSSPAITFRDVAGVEAAKEELREVVACLKDSERYARLNAHMPSGVLLCGSPGTGKTLLAKAVAGEAGVPFFAASASEFVELFVGRGAARIRDLFAEARKKAPCVVFIDELDAVGGRRGLGMNEERDQTLNQLLTELDGFEPRTGVLLLAATNRPEVLDPALTRPGRLSRKVVVPLPDVEGRAAILAVHLRGTPLSLTVDKAALCNQVARVTRGFSGAELANVVNEAALLAGRAGKDTIGLQELLDGVQRTKYGVNGGSSALMMGMGWQRKLQDWMLQRASTQTRVNTSPIGGQ